MIRSCWENKQEIAPSCWVSFPNTLIALDAVYFMFSYQSYIDRHFPQVTKMEISVFFPHKKINIIYDLSKKFGIFKNRGWVFL